MPQPFHTSSISPQRFTQQRPSKLTKPTDQSSRELFFFVSPEFYNEPSTVTQEGGGRKEGPNQRHGLAKSDRAQGKRREQEGEENRSFLPSRNGASWGGGGGRDDFLRRADNRAAEQGENQAGNIISSFPFLFLWGAESNGNRGQGTGAALRRKACEADCARENEREREVGRVGVGVGEEGSGETGATGSSR